MQNRRPLRLRAATVSPPPAIEASFPALVSCAAWRAQATVAASKGESSKAPSGPFQTSVLARSKQWLIAATVLAPASRIMSSAATSASPTVRLGELALNSLATTTSLGSSKVQFRPLALAMMSFAVATRSCSHSDLPTGWPWAARNVLAMPPPMTMVSASPDRLPSRSILVETLAPPTTATSGRFGFSSAASRARSSASMARPA
jgi:hypothetical protein